MVVLSQSPAFFVVVLLLLSFMVMMCWGQALCRMSHSAFIWLFPQCLGSVTTSWQEHYVDDVVYFLLYPIKRHIMSICPITSNVKLGHLVKVVSVRSHWKGTFFLFKLINNQRSCEHLFPLNLSPNNFSSHWWFLSESIIILGDYRIDFSVLSSDRYHMVFFDREDLSFLLFFPFYF